MTAAITDLGGDRDSRRLLLASLAALAVVGAVPTWSTFDTVRDLWAGRDDIAVDWDPDEVAGPPWGGGRTPSPDLSRFTVRNGGRLLVVDTAGQEAVADLGGAVRVAWVSDDLLVAFGAGVTGGFAGLAVVDLAAGTVEQVDTGSRTAAGFRPLSVTNEGQVEACTLVYDQASSAADCGPDRFLVDPTTAELLPA